ncbi:hypothetical protein BG004_003046, partial [Podila humilis]
MAIRLLAESDSDNPRILIYQTNSIGDCYAFGGRTNIRFGTLEDFEPFLDLPDTWYLVDNSPNPDLVDAKTVIAGPPEIFFSGNRHYKNIDKRVILRYNMGPRSLEELRTCRANIAECSVVPLETMTDFYSKIGGVPRYVLEVPVK